MQDWKVKDARWGYCSAAIIWPTYQQVRSCDAAHRRILQTWLQFAFKKDTLYICTHKYTCSLCELITELL